MKMLHKISNFVNGIKSRTFSVVLNAYSGVTQWVDSKVETFANEGYKKNIYVYSAIRAVSKSVAAVGFELYKKPKIKGQDLEEIVNHELLDILEKPNPYESGNTFMNNLVTFLMIYGNVYIEEISPQTGFNKSPKELYLLRPDRVSIVPSLNPSKGLVSHYEYGVNGMVRTIEASKILHIKYIDPLNDFYGLSPIQAAGMAIDQNNLTKSWNIDILNNGGMPSGSLSTTESLTEEQFASVDSQMKDYSGDKRGKIIILQGGLKFERFSMSAEDMSWVAATKMSAREISIVFGVPPEILGDSTNKTYNNYTQARKAFYEETIIPMLEMLTDEIGMWLLPKFKMSYKDFKLTYNKDDIEAIQEDRQAIWDKAINSYFLTLNEKRNLVGFDDVENGDVYLFPSSLVTVKNLKDVNVEEAQTTNSPKTPTETVEEEDDGTGLQDGNKL